MQHRPEFYLASVFDLADHSKPDVDLWHSFYDRVVSHNIPLVDRCEIITMPYNFKLYEPFKIPKNLKNFTMNYQDCCLARAEELLNLSKEEDRPLMVFYSGGIDSTMVVISLLQVSNKTELRDRVVIAMTPDGIGENPNFYYNHILPNFQITSSEQFSTMFTDDYIIVGGEHNDQLFGSDLVAPISGKWEFDRVLEPYTDGMIKEWFLARNMKPEHASWWFDLLVWHAEQAPCEIKSNFDLLWWLNFNFKWQSVFFRMLLRVSPQHQSDINQKYVSKRFMHFYSGIDFQKWSMLNPHLKIKDSLSSYKYHVKDLVFEFTKDEVYREKKLKKGSLFKLFLSKNTPVALTSKYEYLYSIDQTKFYSPVNSFRIFNDK